MGGAEGETAFRGCVGPAAVDVGRVGSSAGHSLDAVPETAEDDDRSGVGIKVGLLDVVDGRIQGYRDGGEDGGREGVGPLDELRVEKRKRNAVS